MGILFETEVELGKEYEEVIKNTAKFTAENAGFLNAEISITVTDNEGIREINREYRELDAATDCLSFPQFDCLAKVDKNGFVMLGDIVISLERAEEQARQFGHSPTRELAFLSVHSCLHLLGYDHYDDETEKEMTAKQEEILSGLGISREK
ncbi:endoribonuclease YbeY [Clostridia bacterium]|nr:endoribonuclease YbeY [Clostridia bacterium]GHU77235.1 endoribonuclease YbeY [Clostridia bacterium]